MHSVLAVDDSAPMRQLVSFTLKNAGFNVVEAMDGISLTKKLRKNPKFNSTPILILTTESSDQMKQAGCAAGLRRSR